MGKCFDDLLSNSLILNSLEEMSGDLFLYHVQWNLGITNLF